MKFYFLLDIFMKVFLPILISAPFSNSLSGFVSTFPLTSIAPCIIFLFASDLLSEKSDTISTRTGFDTLTVLKTGFFS